MYFYDHIQLIIFIMINICCRENQITHFMFNTLFSKKYNTLYKIVWGNMVEPDRPEFKMWRLRFAY
jgi:hypothetical protein